MKPPKRRIRCVNSVEEQLQLWLAGESVHVTVPGRKRANVDCCPDFSCCQPALLQPVEVRQAFVKASEDDRHAFLLRFLRALCDASGEKVHVTG
jgi:hypothetical protein